MMLLPLLLATLPPLALQANKVKLDNGLTVIISADHSVPGVALDLRYHVGSKDEDAGRTGFAHLFEHLMFMGARHVPYPQFDTLMEAAGGTNNASTSSDVTEYHEVGPSNLLETFLWMEADRLATLGQEMTQEKLETQRKIVLNERRQSYENRPYGLAGLALEEHLYPEGSPYHWPVIGSAKDLEAAQLTDVTRFFANWYVPGNAILAIVGDVEPAQAEALVRKYFGWLPGKAIPERKPKALAQLKGEDRLSLTDKVELPRVFVGWLSPAHFQPGDADADLAATILARGKASRLYERLVHKDEIATDVGAEQDSRELQGNFTLTALARPGHTTKELLAAVDDEVKKFAEKGPTAAELASARVRIYTDAARGLEDLTFRAQKLTSYELDFGDPTALQKDLGRYEAATTQSVRDFVKSTLGAARVVVEVQPEAAAAAEPKAAEVKGAKQ